MRYEGPDSHYQVLSQPTGVWYYRVYASNSYGVSPWSNTETARVAPAAPQLLPIDNQDGDRNYLVDWSDVDGAISYRLEEAIDSSFISPTIRYEGASSQFQVTGQYYGTWYYRVLASNAGGNSPWSNVELVRVLQAPPESPVLAPISNPDGNGDYLLDWNEVAGATSYRLEEADNSGFISSTLRYTGILTGFQVSGQQSGVWYYRVLASNEGGNSPWSNTEWVGVIPAAPVLLPISNLDGNGDYLVDWNDSVGATSYRLEEAGNPGFISPTVLYEGAATELQITGQLGGTWYYRVLASNIGGDSPWSNTESVNVIPAAPVLLPISNPDGNGDYLVDWNIVVGATSYRLEEASNPSFISPTVLYVGTATELQINGHLGGTWYYRVLASNAGGDSQWSNAESVSVIPAAPVLLPISNPDGNGDYPVDWNDVTGATSYRLEEANSIEFSYPITLYEGAASQFQVTGQVGGTWYYRVLAINAGGDSPWSNIAIVSVIPEAPVLLPIDNPTGAGDYLVDWVDVSGGDTYLLQEDDNPDFSTPIDRYTGALSQFEVTGQAGGTWYYRVLARNPGGDSAWSNVVSTGVVPATPALLPIDNLDRDGNYLVDWNEVPGATSYRLEEADNPDFNAARLRYEGPDSQLQVLDQPTGIWYYRVYASNAYGISSWTNTEAASVAPAAPQLLPIENLDGDGDYLVGWTVVVSATNYRLQEDDNAEFPSPSVIYDGPQIQYQVTGQFSGTWYYRVLASNAGGDSPWSNIQSVVVLHAPPESPILAPISNPDGNGDYLVDWNEVASASSYRLEQADNPGFISPTVQYEGAATELPVVGQPSGVWYYRVLASNDGGSSPWSNTEWVGVVPGAPVLLPIDNLEGDGDYLVDWNTVFGADSYRLEEADDPGFISPTLRYEGGATELQVNGQAGGTWYYRVLASNPGGDSPWSSSEAVSVIPAAPVLLPISNPGGNSEYLVDWNESIGADNYLLQEDDDPGFATPVERYEGPASQYQVTGQADGTWYYRVLASNPGGSGPWSNTENVSVNTTPLARNIFMPLVSYTKPEPYGVHILASSYSYELHDTLFIIGEVLNNTTENLSLVEVIVDLYDASDRLVGTGTAYLWPLDLPATQRGCFNITMNIPAGWSYYKFEDPQYISGSTSPGLTIIDSNGDYNNGSYNLIGQVWNNGNLTAKNVAVSGTLYNRSGQPVGCKHAYVSSVNLNPGQSSSFAIDFLGYYRDYNDVTSYRLRVAGDRP